MALISLLEGAVIGAVLAVVSPKVYAFVKGEVATVEAKASGVANTVVSAVETDVASKL